MRAGLGAAISRAALPSFGVFAEGMRLIDYLNLATNPRLSTICGTSSTSQQFYCIPLRYIKRRQYATRDISHGSERGFGMANLRCCGVGRHGKHDRPLLENFSLTIYQASAMFGYDSAFIGGTLALPSFQKSFGLDTGAATALKANIVSTFQAGCFFGSLMGFPVSEGFGRRMNLITAGLVFSIGAIVQTVSNGNLAMMYTGRAFTGLGVGASAMIVPIYISECAPPEIRGRLIGVFEVTLQVGK